MKRTKSQCVFLTEPTFQTAFQDTEQTRWRLQKLYNGKLLSWEVIIREEMNKMDIEGFNVKYDIDKSKEALN